MPSARGAAEAMPMKVSKSKKNKKRLKKRQDVALAQSEDEDSVGKSTRPKHREGNTLTLQVLSSASR
jgi:ribosomal protein L32